MKWQYKVLVVVLLLSVWMWLEWPDDKLHVVFCDVGQGDGALITLGYFQMIVDTGAYEDKMLRCLSDHIPFWDRRIEVVTLSHSDKDHVGALPGIKKHYKIDKEIWEATTGDIIKYVLLYIDILKGSKNNVSIPLSGASETNQSSIVEYLHYGNFSVLFTGDIDLENELALVSSGLLKKTTVLKVSHHGSKYGSGMEFLERVSPKISVVSVGKKNSYGHPSSDTLMRLDMVKTKIFRTDLLGTIELVSDGVGTEVFVKK